MIKFDANGQGYFDFADCDAIQSLSLKDALTVINFLYDLDGEISRALDGKSLSNEDFLAIRRGMDERDNLRHALRQHIRALRGLA